MAVLNEDEIGFNKLDDWFYDDYVDNLSKFMENKDLLIDACKKISGKKYTLNNENIDSELKFITIIMDIDRNRFEPYNYNEETIKFIKSDYVSDFIKKKIRFNNTKHINDMTKEEISLMVSKIYDIKILHLFKSYIFKLDGDGIISYIKSIFTNEDIIREIFNTSGLNVNRKYNFSTLNNMYIQSVYKKLSVIDSNYAESFINMLNNLEDKNEFIEKAILLARNDFNKEKILVKE